MRPAENKDCSVFSTAPSDTHSTIAEGVGRCVGRDVETDIGGYREGVGRGVGRVTCYL